MTEQDFKSRSIGDQVWILYQAVSKINEHGCDWAGGGRYRGKWKRLTIFGASIGGGVGFAFMVGKLIHCF